MQHGRVSFAAGDCSLGGEVTRIVPDCETACTANLQLQSELHSLMCIGRARYEDRQKQVLLQASCLMKLETLAASSVTDGILKNLLQTQQFMTITQQPL